jgi:hypothetical protein
MTEIKTYGNSLSLTFFTDVLLHYFSILDDYIKHYGTSKNNFDVPYYYNERASLSILSGAVWKSSPRNLVLEEYCVKKAGSDSGKEYRGRRDIWIKVQDPAVSAGYRECRGEAKQRWGKISKLNAAEIDKMISVSIEEAGKNVALKPSDLKLGIVFKVPKKDVPIAELENKISLYRTELDKKLLVSKNSFIYAHYLNDTLKCEGCKYPFVDLLMCIKEHQKEA